MSSDDDPRHLVGGDGSPVPLAPGPTKALIPDRRCLLTWKLRICTHRTCSIDIYFGHKPFTFPYRS